jgi:hypothetical protein
MSYRGRQLRAKDTKTGLLYRVLDPVPELTAPPTPKPPTSTTAAVCIITLRPDHNLFKTNFVLTLPNID